ncbi:unnamed protein product [Rotaria magnacalcarata]|uniref:Uncharacterized protein n=1 Tax=Rotaria magnacalcarata TaxID=392030 RepID=A0A820NH13_9BILA|nr:unnamed protein product [Rotaria magnacalcarata]CAF4386833.1 unnamed protein product [Rotaria magnacalcarata]
MTQLNSRAKFFYYQLNCYYSENGQRFDDKKALKDAVSLCKCPLHLVFPNWSAVDEFTDLDEEMWNSITDVIILDQEKRPKESFPFSVKGDIHLPINSYALRIILNGLLGKGFDNELKSYPRNDQAKIADVNNRWAQFLTFVKENPPQYDCVTWNHTN